MQVYSRLGDKIRHGPVRRVLECLPTSTNTIYYTIGNIATLALAEVTEACERGHEVILLEALLDIPRCSDHLYRVGKEVTLLLVDCYEPHPERNSDEDEAGLDGDEYTSTSNDDEDEAAGDEDEAEFIFSENDYLPPGEYIEPESDFDYDPNDNEE